MVEYGQVNGKLRSHHTGQGRVSTESHALSKVESTIRA